MLVNKAHDLSLEQILREADIASRVSRGRVVAISLARRGLIWTPSVRSTRVGSTSIWPSHVTLMQLHPREELLSFLTLRRQHMEAVVFLYRLSQVLQISQNRIA